jgi:hypothetical protein
MRRDDRRGPRWRQFAVEGLEGWVSLSRLSIAGIGTAVEGARPAEVAPPSRGIATEAELLGVYVPAD